MDDIFFSTIRIATPLVLAALGGMLSEKSGVANIALECNLLFAAFASAAVVSLSQNLPLGIAAGILASVAVGLLFAYICLWGQGDQIVVGTGMNLFAMGLIPVINRWLFDQTGSTPSLDIALRVQNPYLFFIFGVLAVLALNWFFKSHKFGVQIVAAGNNPLALETRGVSARAVRVKSILMGSVLTGIGGVYLSLAQASGYTRNMSAGRGFLALAALIFGAWKPIPTLIACLFFAFADAIQIKLQGTVMFGREVPNQFIQILPFVATLVGLAFFSRRIRAPRAINQS